ncbi:Na+ H+ antiporter family protein [Lactobacillus selangorensis]|uniref:Na+ H+ antiporter family protein n=1 Tax=Lactobacillus selangorensis TaxID=81857 RepID=A0A0R2FJ37_9LACO|nr:Na+/H+ antiporter NhaC family protein [Lactobacillus selangorensis]KRN28673.1 Na+ H+ antiporter family protein [Lactobacillus selangorensis]KRN32917.1 Na+ H+ antiporter family protein [Lactobacillus selangorensis]
MKQKPRDEAGHFLGLVPLLFFLVVYISSGVVFNNFDAMPLLVAMILATILALALNPHERLNEKLAVFYKGAGQDTMILMIVIFMLAGAFYYVTKSMHAVDTVTMLGLRFLPKNFIIPGVFVLGCLISFAMGTSMGTVAALMPIAAQIGQMAHISLPLLAGVVVSGAMFGDDLSLISASAIISAQTQSVSIFAKFKTNAIMVLPAFILTTLLLAFVPVGTFSLGMYKAVQWLNLLPYVLVIVLSFMNLNVLIVLTLGIISAVLIGLFHGDFTFIQSLSLIHKGILSMADVSFISIIVGGLAALMEHMGGIQWLLQRITKHAHSSIGGKFAIAFLILLLDVITTNNTVSVMIAGPIAKKLGHNYHISPSYTASILDIYSCVGQGLIPYGAQLLMASSLVGISAASIVPYSWYCMLLFVISSLFLLSPYSPKENQLRI